MLRDRFQRAFSYLRISVTDRCNFRCTYCMPEEGVQLSPRDDVLNYEEIARVARVASTQGFSKIRLTGGEPTVRRDLPRLVELLANINGIDDIAMTTNASLLAPMARDLKNAGLQRVNISLDTLRRDRALLIARRDIFEDVMRGIDAALDADLRPVKFNCVVMRGINDDELSDLLAFAHARDAQMRFIEYMPMGGVGRNVLTRLMSTQEMLEALRPRFDLVRENGNENDPARGYICRKSGARVGFISSMSDDFCATCNRMRLTAEGGLRPCLHQDAEVNLRGILRSGGTDEEIVEAFQSAAELKWEGHRMTQIIPLYSAKEMVSIGG